MQYNFNGQPSQLRKWALRGAAVIGGFAVLALLASLLLPDKPDAQAQQNRVPAAPAQPAPAQPAAAQPNIKNFDDWAMLCERPQGAARDSCYVFQQQVATGTNQRLLLVTAGQSSTEGVAAITFALPLGIRLSTGMAVKIDDNPQFSPTIQYCLPDGCLATAALDTTIMQQLNTGKQAVVAFINHVNGQRFDLTVSLKGFATAYKALPTPPPLAAARPAAAAQPAAQPAAPAAPAGQRPAGRNTPQR